MKTIYYLSDLILSDIRYIGCTKTSLQQRLQCHIDTARAGFKRPVFDWIRDLLSLGIRPHITRLEDVKEGLNPRERETYWIQLFRDLGFTVLNINDGGPGRKFGATKMSEETKQKIRKVRTGKKRGPYKTVYKSKYYKYKP